MNAIGTTGKVIDPNGIDHPSHYNGHPSGVEAIEVCRHMSFNLGSAFKYLYRLHDKETPYKNASKALWYVQDEIRNTGMLMRAMYLAIWKLHQEKIKIDVPMGTILACEPDPLVRECLRNIYLADQTRVMEFARDAIEGLQLLVVRHQ
jgi:hypothetical protein